MNTLPAIIPQYTLGPSAGRSQSCANPPTYIVCDASTVDQFHRSFCPRTNSKQYKRYEAISPKGDEQVVFVVTPLEMEILDWAKEHGGQTPDSTALARALRGKGIVKSYDNMRTVTYLDQQIVVPLADTLGRYLEGHSSDFPAKVNGPPRKLLVGDEKRSDVRLGAMIGSMEAIRRQQSNAKFLVCLRGDPIGSHFEDTKSARNSLGQRLLAYGPVLTGLAAHNFPTVLDEILKPDALGVSTQPKPHPPITTPRALQWGDSLPSGSEWVMDPEMQALLSAPESFSPSDCVIRLIADTNVHASLRFEMIDLVGRLKGNIHMVAIPEVTRELAAGTNRSKAERRREDFKRLMGLKPSTWFTVMHRLMRGPRTWLYKAGADPILVEPPTGDIRIRSEMAIVVAELERNFPGRLLIVYITIDYNCELLVRAIPTRTATFLVVRFDGKEKGAKRIMDILFNVMKPWLA